MKPFIRAGAPRVISSLRSRHSLTSFVSFSGHLLAMLFATHMQAHNPAHEVFALKFAQTFVRVICSSAGWRIRVICFARLNYSGRLALSVIRWILGCFTFAFLLDLSFGGELLTKYCILSTTLFLSIFIYFHFHPV